MPNFTRSSEAILLAPCAIRQRHLSDQLSDVGRQSRSATLTRLPLAKQLEAFAMPADQCVRFHDYENSTPIDQPRHCDERDPRRIVGATSPGAPRTRRAASAETGSPRRVGHATAQLRRPTRRGHRRDAGACRQQREIGTGAWCRRILRKSRQPQPSPSARRGSLVRLS
jgi:hypothetical protein